MRTYIFSAVATLTLGLLTVGPASAENAPWTCMSPAFACGGAPVAKTYRTKEFAGERKSRRQASSKRNRVAKKDDGVKRAERADKTADRKQAKVELPERKQVEAPAKPEAQAKPQTQGATEPAKDKTVGQGRDRKELSDDLDADRPGVLLRLRRRFADGLGRALQPQRHDGRTSHPAVRHQGARHQQAQRQDGHRDDQ